MIADARSWLKSRADTIPDVTGYPEPGQAFTFPCLVFDWATPAADYREAGNSAKWTFKAYLLVPGGDQESGYKSLDRYIDTTGKWSVKAALEGDATNTTFDVSVVSCDEAGQVKLGAQLYYGALFTVEVYSSEG